jgi:hypothetical protein
MLISVSVSRHLETKFIALDANFRMKQKERGLKDDEGLTKGAGHFVEPGLFARELQRMKDHPEPRGKSTCESTFAAIERANNRMDRGFSVTGVVAAIDSRHGFLPPTAVADRQRGER